MPVRDRLLALLVVLVWGLNFVVMKLGLQSLGPMLLGALRFAAASLPFLLFVRPLIRGPALRLNGLVGLTWNDSRMNDYYFGVTPAEAAAGPVPQSAATGPAL